MGNMQVGVISAFDSNFAMVFYLLAFFLVLLMAYFATRFIAKNQGFSGNKNIRIVERTILGNDRTLLLYELEGVYYLMYIHKNGATLIDKRSDVNLIDPLKKENRIEFSDILKKFSNRDKGSKDNEE